MKRLIVFTILAVLVLGFFPLGYSQALTIGPPKFEFSADPGETLTGKINLRNEMEQTMTWYSSFESFSMKGESGEPQFSGKRENLASWIETDPRQITLGPGEGGTTSFTIQVPEDADPGGHYAAIFWGTAPAEGVSGGGIGVVSRMAVLVLLNVSGDVIESGEVSNFRASGKVFAHLPVNFSLNFRNTGTVHLKPEGEIVIQNIFGKTTEVLSVSTEGHYILPGYKRGLSAVWEKEGFTIGYYKAILNLQFGEKGTSQAKTSFWVIPWRTLLFGLLILALLILGVVKGIKTYNRWIISKARESRI